MNALPRPGPSSLAVVAALLLLTLAGCTSVARNAAEFVRLAEVTTCVNRCQDVKDRCDDNARFDYQQCQAGYEAAQRRMRWCHSAGEEHCGYPWWSCSENLYGYCTNRYWECHGACQRSQR